MRNTRLLLLAAPLFFGAAFGTSAAPHKAEPAKAAPPAVFGGPFRDVPPNHWAAQAVETLRQKGIVRGYPGGISRTQATKEGMQGERATRGSGGRAR